MQNGIGANCTLALSGDVRQREDIDRILEMAQRRTSSHSAVYIKLVHQCLKCLL